MLKEFLRRSCQGRFRQIHNQGSLQPGRRWISGHRQADEAALAGNSKLRQVKIDDAERRVKQTHRPTAFIEPDHLQQPIRAHDQWAAMRDKILTQQRIADYNRQHRALAEAIASRDVEGAVAMVTSHLHYARRQLMGAEGSL